MPKNYIPANIRRQVDECAKGVCEYCKCLRKYTPESHEYEHIIPSIQGGKSVFLNIAKACRGCNNIKSISIAGLDPETNQIVRLFNPRKDNWKDHFKWSADFLKMIGLTPIGRATIIRLKTNRQELMNLRKVTLNKGHPPD